MFVLSEKLKDFQLLLFNIDNEGNLIISRHKTLILVLYILSFVLTFLHFATLSPEVIEDVHSAFLRGEDPEITIFGFMSITALLYLYISAMALYSLFKNGNLPNYFQRPKFPSIRRRYKILLGLLLLFFTGLVLILVYLALFFTFISIIALGPIMFSVWMVLEPFFLLSGLLVFIDIIDTDYPLEGYSKYRLSAIFAISFIGIFVPLGVATLLGYDRPIDDFLELSVFNFELTLYIPAIVNYIRTLSGIVIISFLFMVVWFLKDRLRGTEEVRERKKGILPLFLGLSLLFISASIVPTIATASGSLAELTSILDLLGLFIAIILGIWRILGIEQRTEPLVGNERINPIQRINRLHPYSKTLVLMVMSIWGFYYTLENAAIAVITGAPDKLKEQQLNLMAGLVGIVYIIILWRFKGKLRSDTPGVLKETSDLLKVKIKEVKESF